MNGFSVEESNLISIFATEGGAFSLESRRSVIEDIIGAMKYLEDGELLELSERVVGKLEAMTDEEFAGVEFVAEE